MEQATSAESAAAQMTPEGTMIMPSSREPATGPEGTMVLPRSSDSGSGNTAPAAEPAPQPAAAYLPAAFWKRLLARWVDANLLFLLGLLGAAFINIPFKLGGLLLPLVYFGLLHGQSGQTLGKKLMGIQLVKNGAKVGYPKAFLRAVADNLNMITLGVGYLMAAFTAKKQALHDILCKTQVVSVKPVPVWAVAASLLLPPGAWVAVVFTVGLSMIAAVAGPMMFLSKSGGINVQPNINININAEGMNQASGNEEEFPEDETAPQESVKISAAAPAPPAPDKAVRPSEPAKRPEPAMAVTRPPVASQEAQMAANKASEKYLKEKYGSKLGGSMVQPDAISEVKRRGIVQAKYLLDGKEVEEKLLLIQFQSGWKVVRPLSTDERMDWSTGKIVGKR